MEIAKNAICRKTADYLEPRLEALLEETIWEYPPSERLNRLLGSAAALAYKLAELSMVRKYGGNEADLCTEQELDAYRMSCYMNILRAVDVLGE